ncbi:MAG: hypothetical protein ACXV8Q_08625 [Methylobacter sp.]
MKIFDLLKIVIGLGFFLLSTFGLADSASHSDQQSMEIACRYQMKVTPRAKTKASSNKAWFFWRTSNMIQTQDTDGDYGEIWERTVTGNIQYRKLYHADKTAVEYMSTDMPVNNISFDWVKLSGMLSQQELDQLKAVKKTRVLGRNAELLKGKIGGQSLEVLWLPNEGLPASIIRKDKTGSMALHLVEITALSAAHRKPVAVEEISNYRHIDAADFGDMENDPFVRKVLAAEGHHHH